MDLRAICRDLPGSNPIPSTSDELLSNNASDSESDSDLESGEEDEVQSSDSDTSTGNSVSCPICLLKFKGQAIGFPEVCEHPFCLDCILEWSKNVQTCPNDRRKFETILVRLDLEGEVVRRIPVKTQNKHEEEAGLLDITPCQVCRLGDREDMLLLCDRCDQGYHMDCLDPPLEEVPIEDWFCSQCDGTRPVGVAATTRQRAPLTLRVRRTVQRNRQIALRDSSVAKKNRKGKGKKRKTTYRRKRRVKGKGKGKRRKKAAAVPSPRKRLADALGMHDRSSGPAETGSAFSIFGDPNALDAADDNEDETIRNLISPKKQPKSLIAQLAESRKAQKSIYAFGPVAAISAPVRAAAVPKLAPQLGNPDLLGSIFASQTQLATFGKSTETLRPSKPRNTSSNRVLGAILASQATLSRLDETIQRLGESKEQITKKPDQPKPIQSRQPVRSCTTRQNDATDQGSNSSSNHQAPSGEGTTNNNDHPAAARSNGQSTGENSGGNGISGGSDGNGEDPNWNRKKKSDPEDKKDDADEEDVDLYSDIESVEEENEPQLDLLPKNEATEEDRIPEEEDDEKGLVIDDTNAEDSGRRSTDSSSDPSEGEPVNKVPEEEVVEQKEPEMVLDGIPLPEVAPVVPQTVHRFQHGGLPAAAAALTFGPKGGVVSRPQLRKTAPPTMNDLMKANLVSSIASALKESLTSAFLAQSQPDSLATVEQDEALPAPCYSDTKDAVVAEETAEPAPVEPAPAEPAPVKEVKSSGRKQKMEEIFGSDDDDQKEEADQLEQISDCEEGELDESEASEPSDQELPPSGNRIVRMLTPPPATQTRPTGTKGDCEEGEIVDKKDAKKRLNSKKKKSSEEVAVTTEDCDFLRSAGIGGERRVELSLEDEGIPSTFKKLDSGKTRHYRHQGDIKVVEGRGEIKPKKEKDGSEDRDDKRSKRQEMKRYDVRRVVEQRSRSDRHSTVKSEHRSRSESKTKSKSKDHSSKKSKPRRKRSSSSSSSTSSSSSSSSFSSLSPDRKKGKENQRKRSRSSSSEGSSRKKRKTKLKSKDRSEEKSSRDKKKKGKKKKKVKDKHKEKKAQTTMEGKSRTGETGSNGTDPNADDIEIPSKAVFASGDKIVVSLHFGSSSSSKPVAKKKKRKTEEKTKEPATKRPKEEVRATPPPEQSAKKSSSLTKSESTEKSSSKKSHSSSVKAEQTPKKEVAKVHSESRSTDKHSDVPKDKEPPKPKEPAPRRVDDIRDMRGRGRGRVVRPVRHHRSKPVLIDIETSREIPLEDNRPSDVIVLSDSEESDEESNLPPLPPLPPPPPPPQLVQPEQQAPPLPPPPTKPSVVTSIKPKGGKNPLFSKHGTAVKFSLASKSNSIKKLNNPLLLLGGTEEEEEEEEPQQPAPVVPTVETSPSKQQKADTSSDPAGGKAKEDFLMNLPLPDGPRHTSPTKAAGNISPIFRPSTPPVKPSSPLPTSTYDPSQPTHTPSSGSSTPTHSPSPVVNSPVKLQQPHPPLPPPPTPPMMAGISFPLPHPGAVLMPPMTSLPPPPLPPPPLLTSAPPPFTVHPANLISGVYNTSFPPPNITGLLPLPTPGAPLLNQVMKMTPAAPPQPLTSIPAHGKTGRPMTPPSPTPSEGSDIFGPPSPMSPSSPMSNQETSSRVTPSSKPRQTAPAATTSSATASSSSSFDSIFQSASHQHGHSHRSASKPNPSSSRSASKSAKPTPTKSAPSGTAPSAPTAPTLGQDGPEECPSSAVELQVKEKFLKKLNRQERVVEEVRLALKPYYTSKRISKGDYKEILRKCVPKICHTKSGEINPIKIKEMVKGYVKKFRYQHKKTEVS